MCRAIFLPGSVFVKGPRGRKPPKSPKIRLRKGDFILNYTENYQLNQWESADRVLRTDFNEDNRKIDEALEACRTRDPQLLKSITVSDTTPQVDIDVSDIDFDHWHTVLLRLEILGDGEMRLRSNQSYSEFFNQFSVFESTSDCLSKFPARTAGQRHEIYFFPLCDKRRLITALTLSDTVLLGCNYLLSYENLTTLTIAPKESNQTLHSGSKLFLYGLHL